VRGNDEYKTAKKYRRIFMKIKELISAIVALAMSTSLITAVPMSVSAATTQYEEQEYTFDDTTLPSGWAAGTGDGYSITDGQLVLAGSPNWGVDVTFDPNLRESGKYKIGWDYTTQATSFGDYGLFLKLLDSADMSQVKEVFSHMGDGQIHLGNQVFWNITTPTSRMELEVDVDTKEWQLYVDGVAVTNAGGSGVGTWTESLAIGFMNYQHGTCKIDNVTVTKVVPQEKEIVIEEVNMEEYEAGGKAWDIVINEFDGANTYIASFTDGEESKTGKIGFKNVETDGGSVAFAIFLHTSRASVEFDIIKE